MDSVLVSVIIPAYNAADVIGEAIQSVLRQTLPRFELIVVDDASQDDTAKVVSAFEDSRVRLIVHSTNRGAHGARLTGFQASSGRYVAFLDQDDLFHRDKLQAHVTFLDQHPETGFTYNPHFTQLHPSGWISGIWRPPTRLSLADLIVGFPIPPSVWVLRREWAVHDEFWDRSAMLRGAETTICGRLFVRGCRFSLVDRVLNYRRIHVGRRFSNPVAKCRDERRCQEIMLSDPRCPADVASLGNRAAADNYLVWAIVALAQEETDTGVELLREALRLEPGLDGGHLSRLLTSILNHALEAAEDPEARIDAILRQLPSDLAHVSAKRDWLVLQAHLFSGARHVIWGRPAEAAPHLARASELGGYPDEFFYATVCHELLSHARECGQAHGAALALSDALAGVPGHDARRLKGSYYLGLAFQRFGDGVRRDVPAQVVRAFVEQPSLMANRGAWSILVRSTMARPPVEAVTRG